MAKGKGFSSNREEWAKIEFCNVEMSAEQKKKFKALEPAEIEDLIGKTAKMIANGYKASITFDDTNVCYIFTLTCKTENDPNFNLCMSSRSDNVFEAMALAAYKTQYCCPDGEWSGHKRDFSFG